MIAHSNILNEIFRGKFSHNRDHCSPPPAAGPCKGGWQLGAARELGLTRGRMAWGFLAFLWFRGWGWLGDSVAKAPWSGWKGVPLGFIQGKEAVATPREKADNCSCCRLRVLTIPLVVRCSGGRLGLSRWHSSLCVRNSAWADGRPQKSFHRQSWKNAFLGFSPIHS